MELRKAAEGLKPSLVDIRRTIHMKPELGFEEEETSAFIKASLDKLGIPYKSGFAKTGIVATIVGSKPGKSVMMRADIDALPLHEANEVEYKSKVEGKMHACGHDTHVACLLGAAELLQTRKEEIEGTIYLLFQPAEEFRPGFYDKPGGAEPMIDDGAVGPRDNPIMDAAIALHITNEFEVGTIGLRSGPSMGSGDTFKIIINGKGGHASAPQHAIDPIFVATQIYSGIQGHLTRFVSPLESYVFTVGKIEIGDRSNIISETGIMEGTFRTLNQELREQFYEMFPRMVSEIAKTYGATAEMQIDKGYPVGVNDEKLAHLIREEFSSMYGADNCLHPPPVLGAEDFFSFRLGGKVPVCMFWLGSGNKEKGLVAPNHSNFFDVDENALPIGAATLVASALRILKEL